MSEAEAMGMFLAFGSAVIGVLILLGLIFYLLEAVGIYSMANNLGLENSWFAFVPILNLYIMGKIIGDFKIGEYEVSRTELILPLSVVAGLVLGAIPLIGGLIQIAVIIINIIAIYYLLKMYSPENALVKTVFSIVLPFMFPIFVFMLRNYQPVGKGSSCINL